jgi:hypothetical protein
MTSVDADLRSGRRLKTGCRSESIIYIYILLQNDCDSSADDEVFNDPSDSWQQESPTTPSTPRSPLG